MQASWEPPHPRIAGKPPPAAWARCSHCCSGHVLLPKGLCAPYLLVLSVSLSGDLSLPPCPLGVACQEDKAGARGRRPGSRVTITEVTYVSPPGPPSWPVNLSGPRRCFWRECRRRPPELGFFGGFPLLGALHLVASGPPNSNEVFVPL